MVVVQPQSEQGNIEVIFGTAWTTKMCSVSVVFLAVLSPNVEGGYGTEDNLIERQQHPI